MLPADFEILFRTHFRSAVLVSQMIVSSKEVAEDIVQDVFIRMLDGYETEELRSPARFLYSSVRNASVDYVRTHSIHLFEHVQNLDIPDNSACDVTPDEIEYANNLRKLINAIDNLPERARNVVKMVCLNKYSYSDAASQLGMTVSTVKTHMYRTFKFLRKHMAVFLF